jgi:hypothetical protein
VRPLALALGLAGTLAAEAAVAQPLVPTGVRLDSLGVLTQLARQGFEVAGVTRVAGELYATVIATPAQGQALALLGLQTAPQPPAAPALVTQFRNWDAVLATLDSLAATGRVTLDTLGTSWEGRPIVAAKVGPADDAPARPNVLFLAGHHAREWISVETALRLLAYLAEPARVPADRDVWVIPVVNPDGYAWTFTAERLWRKNRRPNPDGTYGVDLNRNYPAFWGQDDTGSSSSPPTETYRGPSAGSEPETQAVMAFHDRHPPAFAVSYHSYSDLVLFPYAHAAGILPADQQAFQDLSGTPISPAVRDGLPMAARSAYYPGPAWLLYATNGDYTEWAYRTHGTMAFTVELTAGCCTASGAYGFLFPDDSAAVATVLADNLPFATAVLEASPPAPAARPAWETVWPEARLVGPPGAPPAASATVAGATRSLMMEADSLDRGPVQWRWHAPLSDARSGTRLQAGPMEAGVEVVYASGAELEDGWSGWTREQGDAREGAWAWRGENGALVSPLISLGGIVRPQLAFWTRHEGSLFLPERAATVEVSTDNGLSWVPLARLEGTAPAWYPVTVTLPAASRLHLRIVASEMATWIDAVHVFGDVATPAFAVTAGDLGVSENPVRSSRVHFTWPGGTGDARLSVFTLAGLLVYRTTVSAADGRAAWDLTDLTGAAVGNGAYAVVLEVGGDVLRKRLFVARTP